MEALSRMKLGSNPGQLRAMLVMALLLVLSGTAHSAPVDDRAVAEFSAEMQKRHGFDSSRLAETFKSASRLDSVLAAMVKPAEKKPWHAYRPIFMTTERIAAGSAFWDRHEGALARAEAEYGVPAAIIVAIIGVETFYGRNAGSYRVLDALATLAFHFPPRAPFFRSELENFLLLARDEQMDPGQPKGSYAGAMGLPQFMPSSFRNFAVDFDKDGKRNIWTGPEDAIGSVGNYLARHGWRRDQPIAVQAATREANAAQASQGMELVKTLAEYREAGVLPLDEQDPALQAVLLGFEDVKGMEYWFGFRNFYAITRYNRSPKYALAVAQLADAVAQKRRLQADRQARAP